MATQVAASGPALLTQQSCAKLCKPRALQLRSQRRLHVTAALPNPLSAWKDTAVSAGKAALLAAMLTTGLSVAPLDAQLLQPARADEEAGLSAAQRRANANERRKALLAKARENALSRGQLAGDESVPAGDDTVSAQSNLDEPQARGTSLFDVKPEQPQLKSEPAKPEAPKAPEQPKASLPDKSRFSMPEKPPMQAPPSPSLTVPKEAPKTESPTLPTPTPQQPTPAKPTTPLPQTASASKPAPTPAPAPAATQGFNWDDFSKAKEPAKPKTSALFSVEPEKKQAPAISQETKDRLASQARNQGKPLDKRAAKRHGPPLFLVQLLLTLGLGASLFFAVTKYDAMMANSAKLEKKVIELLEKVQTPF